MAENQIINIPYGLKRQELLSLAGQKRQEGKEEVATIIESLANDVFDAVDKNKNGKIDEDELVELAQSDHEGGLSSKDILNTRIKMFNLDKILEHVRGGRFNHNSFCHDPLFYIDGEGLKGISAAHASGEIESFLHSLAERRDGKIDKEKIQQILRESPDLAREKIIDSVKATISIYDKIIKDNLNGRDPTTLDLSRSVKEKEDLAIFYTQKKQALLNMLQRKLGINPEEILGQEASPKDRLTSIVRSQVLTIPRDSTLQITMNDGKQHTIKLSDINNDAIISTSEDGRKNSYFYFDNINGINVSERTTKPPIPFKFKSLNETKVLNQIEHLPDNSRVIIKLKDNKEIKGRLTKREDGRYELIHDGSSTYLNLKEITNVKKDPSP